MKKKWRCKILIIVAILLLCASWASAADKTLTFAWEQTISSDFAGWTLYWGSVSGELTNKITIPYSGTEEQTYSSDQTLSADHEQTLYFALDAFDLSNNHSAKTEEISHTFDFVSPEVPITFSVKVQKN